MSGKPVSILMLITVLVLSYFSVRPVFIKGYFPVHDDTQPARVLVMSEQLRKGIFPVRLVDRLGYGYGYPLFNFYAPLPYYLGSLFHLAGFSLIFSVKLMFAFGVILAAVFMYLLAVEIAGSFFAAAAAVFYLYAPYHAVNVYVRGAVGEYYAYAFLPLLGLGILRVIKSSAGKSDHRIRPVLPLILGLAGILLSHNIFGLVTLYLLIILILYGLYRQLRKKGGCHLMQILMNMALGIGLSAFFILPAFLESHFTRVAGLSAGSNSYDLHFISLFQLWDSPWGFGGSVPGLNDGMSFKIGKLHLLIAVLGLIRFIFLGPKNPKSAAKKFLVPASLFLFLLSVFFMLPVSSFLYRLLPYMNFIQYPWRFLNISLFALSLGIAPLFYNMKNKFQAISAFLIIFSIQGVNLKYFNPRTVHPFDEADYKNPVNLKFTISRISDEYLPPGINIPQTARDLPGSSLPATPEMPVYELTGTTVFKKFMVDKKETGPVVTKMAYFPGWQAKIDSSAVRVVNREGLIALHVPAGKHILELEFKNTPVRFTGNAISISSIVLLLYLLLVLPIKYILCKEPDPSR
ncbi:hypothetical protein A3D05_04505 [Candidatus Gottesmanbacteria bacterium RIFCSPHIGHO2_02_FULL_40_24]|nr:MAG: hypothetical protein A3D05_04505 [Candidatus Gottesmanbacteria bacterium RIFCSPHIGHO2_02_FULL_40_24]OGG20859.1 MAG: hypothetical protein A3B48_06625 [Candidatus Gottesmanbacteria bacterium RIFCSPLOWO2_01_FULL_40_10]OGG31699.1 MAG: hypothetical protein A3I80_05320 [Candidatus Gottesmanbacteria bacterium RIFCSPLOWO2_02_FULL_40_10]